MCKVYFTFIIILKNIYFIQINKPIKRLVIDFIYLYKLYFTCSCAPMQKPSLVTTHLKIFGEPGNGCYKFLKKKNEKNKFSMPYISQSLKNYYINKTSDHDTKTNWTLKSEESIIAYITNFLYKKLLLVLYILLTLHLPCKRMNNPHSFLSFDRLRKNSCHIYIKKF